MGLFDWFKPKLVIADAASLASFLETRTAFLVQKTTWEYARARAATNYEKLFKEEEFITAVNLSCWSNYPHCLTHEAQMVEGVLRRRVDGHGVYPGLAAQLSARPARLALHDRLAVR